MQKPPPLAHVCQRRLWLLLLGAVVATRHVAEAAKSRKASSSAAPQRPQSARGATARRKKSSCELLPQILRRLAPGRCGRTWKSCDCKVDGVHCSTSGKGKPGRTACAVTSLELPGEQLKGSIPGEIGELKSLTHIELGGNLLHGTLPDAVGELSRLEVMNLSINNISGSLTPALGELSALEVLAMAKNSLEGDLPVELAKLTSLTILDMYSCRLTGSLEDIIGHWTSLQSLSLGRNRIYGSIPEAIGNLKLLEDLDLQSNLFHGGIPTSLSELASLTVIQLKCNALEGPLRGTLKELPAVTDLDLSGNFFDGPLPNVGGMTSLVHLWISRNHLSGTVPNHFLAGATKLAHLSLSANALSGTIPKAFTDGKHLSRLSLSFNRFEGTVPHKLGNLQKLWHLDLHHNQLEGGFPDLLRKLPRLLDLQLQGNPLGGALPKSLGLFVHLRSLHLQGCGITGSIGDAIATLTNLRRIYLHSNSLQGMLPENLMQHAGLNVLYLAANGLEGSIPAVIERMTSLQELNLGQNQLSGSIPKGVQYLSRLTLLMMASNRLEGLVPKVLATLTNLQNVSFANNALEGSLPRDVKKLMQKNPQAFAGNVLDGSSTWGQLNTVLGPLVTTVLVVITAILEFGAPMGPMRLLFSGATLWALVVLIYSWCVRQLLREDTEDEHMEKSLAGLLGPLLHCVLSAKLALWLQARRSRSVAAEAVAAATIQADDKSEGHALEEMAEDLAGRGLHVAELVEFIGRLGQDDCGSMPHYDPRVSTTHDVVRQAIIPATKDEGSSYASMVSGGQKRTPMRMVVHCWGSTFNDLAACVLADATDDRSSVTAFAEQMYNTRRMERLKARVRTGDVARITYFIDAFSINHHTSICDSFGDVPGAHVDTTGLVMQACDCGRPKRRHGKESELHHFQGLLRRVHTLWPKDFWQVIVVDTDLQVFRRTWCVMEIVEAVRLETRQRLVSAGLTTSQRDVRSALDGFNLADCQASFKEDGSYLQGILGDAEQCHKDLCRALSSKATGSIAGRSRSGFRSVLAELSGVAVTLVVALATVVALDYGTKWSV